MTAIELTSVLTCPACGQADTLAMPTDACLFFHECAGCHTLLRPKAGDCCVFCSYGSVPCPPIQVGSACGASGEGPDRDAAAAECCGAVPQKAVGASGSRAPERDA